MPLLANRSPRFQRAGASAHGPGPGSYIGSFPNGAADAEAKGIMDSPTERVPITKWGSKLVTPGPGSYELRRADPKPGDEPSVFMSDTVDLSAASFRSTRSRISIDNLKEPILVPGSTLFQPAKSADNPGPGQYNSQGQLSKQSWSYPAPCVRPLMRAKTAPSFLPLKKEVRYPGTHGDTPAPGDYDSSVEDRSTKSAARRGAPSVDFHTSTSQRVAINGKVREVPGPGAYEAPGLPSKGTISFMSQTQRSSVEIECLVGYPGPETRFEPKPKGVEKAVAHSCVKSVVPREGQFFNARLPFSKPESLKNPGPGQYAGPSSVMQSQQRKARPNAPPGLDVSRKRFHGVHSPSLNAILVESDAAASTPFGSTEARPVLVPDLRRSQSEVGQYNASESLGQSMSTGLLKEQARVGKGGAFGGSRSRERFIRTAVEVEAEAAPAPGHHQPDGVEFHVQKANPGGALLKSATPQCYEPPKGPRPGPGAYDLAIDLAPAPKAKLGTSMAKQFSGARTQHLSFGSSVHADRFSGPDFRTAEERPGAGEYNPSPPP